MKKSIQTLVAAALLGAFSLAAQAQPAVKVAVVDLNKLLESHYKTAEKMAQLQADEAKAAEEVGNLQKQLDALVEEYKGLVDQTNNPALTPEAKSKAQNDAQKKGAAIQSKQTEGQNFVQNSRSGLQQRLQTFRNLILEEITKTATDVAKRKGATLLLDKAGPTAIGISNVIYSDPAFDITDEVLKEINKDRPVTPAASTTTTPAPAATAPAAPAASGSPMIQVPGAKK